MRTRLAVGFVSTAAAACSGATNEACEATGDPSACLDERYFGSLDAPAVPRCTPASADVDASLSVRLFHGPGLTDADVADQARRLQRFYAPYGVTFHAAGEAEATELAYAMSGSGQQIEEALDEAGIPVDGAATEDETLRAHRAVGDVIFAGLRAFVASHASAEPRLLDFVLLDRIVEPRLAEYMFGSGASGFLGFGLSSAMLARLDPGDAERDLYEVVGLPEGFTPLILLGHRDIQEVDHPGDNVVAHEAGHALGLAHSTDPDNLMYPSPRGDCDAGLSAEQLAQVTAAAH